MKFVAGCVVAAVAVALVAGCGSNASDTAKVDSLTTAARPAMSVPAEVAPPAPVVPPAPATPESAVVTTMSTSAPAAAAPAIMPEVVCMNLQAAQNQIQAAGVFFSRSADATGRGRHQVLDRNWVVVSQTPAAGTPIGEGDAVLSVVKIGEPGDCS